ncbi:hypothetical protein AAY473_001817 [Plecturocebus cupreus]
MGAGACNPSYSEAEAEELLEPRSRRLPLHPSPMLDASCPLTSDPKLFSFWTLGLMPVICQGVSGLQPQTEGCTVGFPTFEVFGLGLASRFSASRCPIGCGKEAVPKGDNVLANTPSQLFDTQALLLALNSLIRASLYPRLLFTPGAALAQHFGRLRWAAQLSPGVRDQHGQHGKTPFLLKTQKLARHSGTRLQSQLFRIT